MESPSSSPVEVKEKKKSNLLRMAEPVHRDVPMGASTGQSIRAYPKSCIQQVKDVCLYYVGKCSGKYEDNVAAARYVHQMAEEVISLLAGVAGEIKRNKSEPELFQKLLDEWNENFPSSLGAMGSPKAIAALISRQAVELNDLRSALEGERARRDKDVSEILRSMDAQLQAYRNSVMSERRHQQLVEQQQQEAYKLAAEEVKRSSEERFEYLTGKQNAEIQQMRETYERQTEKLQRRLAQYQEKTQSNYEHYMARIEKVKASKQKKYDKLLAKYRVAQEKYYQLACTVQDDPSCLSNPSFDETTVLSKLEYEVPEEPADSEDEEQEDLEILAVGPSKNNNSSNSGNSGSTAAASAASTSAGGSPSKAAIMAEANANLAAAIASSSSGDSGEEATGSSSKRLGGISFDASADKPEKRRSSSSRLVGVDSTGSEAAAAALAAKKAYYDQQLAADMRVRYLTEQLESQRGLAAQDRKTIEGLVGEVGTLRGEIDTLLMRLRESESLNETYRQSLAMRLGVRPSGEVPPFAHKTVTASVTTGCTTSSSKGRRGCSTATAAANKVLCHTPHFLGPDDKAGCRTNQPVLSGYQVAGRW